MVADYRLLAWLSTITAVPWNIPAIILAHMATAKQDPQLADVTKWVLFVTHLIGTFVWFGWFLVFTAATIIGGVFAAPFCALSVLFLILSLIIKPRRSDD